MDNYTMVLLRATGNLAKLKIYLALMQLYNAGAIDDSFTLIGISNEDLTQDDFDSLIKAAVGGEFNFVTHYRKLDINSDNFDILSKLIEPEADVIFYLAISPGIFQCAVEKILLTEKISKRNVKVLLEKPYGINYDDTVNLNKLILENDFEDNVYRVDHYLAKSGTERLVEFKKENFDRWNKTYIDEITIVLAETVGIEDRLDFYRETGAIADVVQNHIFQLLLRIISDDNNREEFITSILDSLENEKNYFKARQYLDFEKETMFYCRMYINIDSWERVNFNIITGKCMTEKATGIEIKWTDNSYDAIDFLDISKPLLSDYALLISDCMQGNHTKFVSSKEAEATWLFGRKLRNAVGFDFGKYESGKTSLEDVLSWIKSKH